MSNAFIVIFYISVDCLLCKGNILQKQLCHKKARAAFEEVLGIDPTNEVCICVT